MVPANSVELAFIKPDAIASMDDEEIEDTCIYNEDTIICEEEYFYVRCVLPLPVHDKGENYCLGVWAQVSEKSYNHIYELWDIKDQTNEKPLEGLLANNVPLTTGSEDVEITVQLIGETSRPVVTIIDKKCSLYQEQTCGITIHRANEYSELCQ